MKKLRKRRRLGEFNQVGMIVTATRGAHIDGREWDAFIREVELASLGIGGIIGLETEICVEHAPLFRARLTKERRRARRDLTAADVVVLRSIMERHGFAWVAADLCLDPHERLTL